MMKKEIILIGSSLLLLMGSTSYAEELQTRTTQQTQTGSQSRIQSMTSQERTLYKQLNSNSDGNASQNRYKKGSGEGSENKNRYKKGETKGSQSTPRSSQGQSNNYGSGFNSRQNTGSSFGGTSGGGRRGR